MTLKKKIAINIAVAFSLLFGLAVSVIYYSFSSFRAAEFKERLNRKALTAAKLLIEVQEIDKSLLKLIDKNNVNKLYDEHILIFNDSLNLLYNSLDDTIDWHRAYLTQLKNQKNIFIEQQGKEILGISYTFEGKLYYILIAAQDKYGNNELQFLFYTLSFTFLVGIIVVWFLTYFFIKKLLAPLDSFEKQITDISVNRLNVRLNETAQNDEINLLTKAFNQMLLRIEEAFNSQKEFTSNASHEMRTPLTRIAFQLENLLKDSTLPSKNLNYLKNIYNDIHHLSDLVNSLLLLSRFSEDKLSKNFQKERIDEIIFNAYQRLKEQEPQLEFNFEINDKADLEPILEVYGAKPLLEIAFFNLLKNACLYSNYKKVTVRIESVGIAKLLIHICNEGQLLTKEEQKRLFEPFFRGDNAANIYGSGLGLRIVKRIFNFHQAVIEYKAIEPNINQFSILFNLPD